MEETNLYICFKFHAMKLFFKAIMLLSTAFVTVAGFAQGPDSALVHKYFNELQQAVISDHGQF
jgi:hypothetical protein